ncbi:pilus assembly protein CpaE [Humitalea rosea]|uniref:Pilus assembly protein CpaE n=1 Tax=Humitalea rosea TaxID=990373 RepID=A0A2W7IR15_9PROT|nr:P-loop NTPase [Humitalea rosea]PZW48411.1 pilus assembly protein CpaE [Humitalea rosea]
MGAEPWLLREAPDAPRGATPGLPLGDRPGFLAFVADEASETALRGGLPKLLGDVQIRRGDARVAARVLEREPTPGVLLVDISGIADPLQALEALAAVCTPDVRVLAIGDQADIGFYRRLTRDLGVAEYLHKPLTRDMVARLFGPQLAGEAAAAAAEALSRGSHVVAVCGARGGCGATTIAVNLAVQLSESSRGHVALLDLHLRGGTAGLMLGVRPGTGLRVALEEPDRVDALFLDRVGIPIDDRLRLIAADEPMDSMPKPSEVGVQRVLEMLRHRFNFVVLDLPMPPTPAGMIALAAARHCVLVLGPDIAGIRDTLALRKLVNTGGSSRATIVLNRAGLPGGLKLKLVEEGLGMAPDVVIPDLPRHLPRAANLGRPAVRETPALRRAMEPLMQEIAAVAASGIPSSFFARLFGGKRA